MKALYLNCCTLVLIFYVASLSTALKCDGDKLPLVSRRCIEFIKEPASNLEAHQQCQDSGGLGLVTVVDNRDLEHLRRYIAVLGEEGVDYWLGYYYRDNGFGIMSRNHDHLDCGNPVLAQQPDFGTQDPLPPGVEVCLTFRKDGLFYRRQCNESLPYICLQRFESPEVISLSLSTSRFITTPGQVTLTCNHTNSVSTTWRRNGVQIEQSSQLTIETPNENVTTLTVDTTGGDLYGQYECVVDNGIERAVSEVVELVNGTGIEMEAPEILNAIYRSTRQFSSPVSLPCAFSSNITITTVQWFINGVQVDTNHSNLNIVTNSTQSVLAVEALLEEGVYQCRVFNDNGENSVDSTRLYAFSGTPSPLDVISVVPDTKTSLLVQWLPPVTINTYHPLLLRYNIQYQEVGEDSSTPFSVNGLLPVLANGLVSESGLSEFILTINLTTGTDYVVTMSAESTSDYPSKKILIEAFAATYGDAPEETVKELTVSRTLDNKTVVAMWDQLLTTPPTGEVENYEVQYRNLGKDFINVVQVPSQFNYLVISPVEDANDYEVRVRAGVRVSRDPVEFEYNDFTAWEPVKGVTTKVPPTQGGLNDRPGEIVAIVVSVVCVIALISLILVAGIICLVVRKRNDRPQRLRTESDSKVVNMSALQDNEENMIQELEKQPF